MARSGRAPGGRGTPATVVLELCGRPFTLHAYHHDPRATAFGDEAAAALQVAPSRIFKTLVVDVDSELVVAVVPVSARLDLKALAAAVGGKRATMAEAARVERSSGYVVGGISPLGQRTPLPTVLDESAVGQETVFVSAGRRGLQVELAPRDLIDVTQAKTAVLARSD